MLNVQAVAFCKSWIRVAITSRLLPAFDFCEEIAYRPLAQKKQKKAKIKKSIMLMDCQVVARWRCLNISPTLVRKNQALFCFLVQKNSKKKKKKNLWLKINGDIKVINVDINHLLSNVILGHLWVSPFDSTEVSTPW